MKVRTAATVGLLLGLLLGNTYGQPLQILTLFLGLVGVVMILKGGKQVIKGAIGGLLGGLCSGYFLYTVFADPSSVLALLPK